MDNILRVSPMIDNVVVHGEQLLPLITLLQNARQAFQCSDVIWVQLQGFRKALIGFFLASQLKFYASSLRIDFCHFLFVAHATRQL